MVLGSWRVSLAISPLFSCHIFGLVPKRSVSLTPVMGFQWVMPRGAMIMKGPLFNRLYFCSLLELLHVAFFAGAHSFGLRLDTSVGNRE